MLDAAELTLDAKSTLNDYGALLLFFCVNITIKGYVIKIERFIRA